MSTPRSRSQVSEDALLQLLERMFPEGEGAPQLTVKVDTVAQMVNGLLVDAKAAVLAFWKARGYNPKTPELTKQKLGYALDQEDALGGLVVRAMGMKPLFTGYQGVIGKRVNNMLTPLNVKLKALRKSGARGEADRLALLQALAKLNLDPPPPTSRKRPAPEPPTDPAPEPAARRGQASASVPASEPPPLPELTEPAVPSPGPIPMELPLSMRCPCWFQHQPRPCPSRNVRGSLPAALAIYAAVECEQLGVLGTDDDFVDSDDEDYDQPTEKLKMDAYNRYDAVLKSLAAWQNRSVRGMCCMKLARGECEHDQPCGCGAGVRPAWPWMLWAPESRFCPDCRRDLGEVRRIWCESHAWISQVGLSRALEAIPAEMR